MTIEYFIGIVARFLLNFEFAYYLITLLQWYNYSLYRIIFMHHKFMWHIWFFLLPLSLATALQIQGYTEYSTDHHLIDLQLLAVLQYDDVKATKGFIPYIAAGMDVAVSIVNSETVTSNYKTDSDGAVYLINTVKTNENDTAANVGFVVGAGLRYAFSNNFTTGFGVDYTYVFTNHDYSGVRVFVDAGYRF